MAEGVDFSFSRVSGAALRAAGKTFVVRYLWAGGKGISRAEYDDFVRNGIQVAFVYEETGAELTGGYAAGRVVASRAQGHLNNLGLPNAVVYFVVDHDYSGAALAAAIQGLQGAASVLGKGRTGFYGGGPHIRAAMNANACSYFWQTYAWSGGAVVPGIHIYQYRNGQTLAGGSVDFVRSYQANFGQVGSALAGGSAIIINDNEEDEMPKWYNTTDGKIWWGAYYIPTGDILKILKRYELSTVDKPDMFNPTEQTWIAAALGANGLGGPQEAAPAAPVDVAALAATIVAEVRAQGASLTTAEVSAAVVDALKSVHATFQNG